MAEIPRKYHQSSKEKWEKILKKTKKHERFSGLLGFYNLMVVTSCGYCEYFKGDCDECSLGQKGICCSTERDLGLKTLFSKYVNEMCKMFKDEPNFEKAAKYAQKILDAIMEDTPVDFLWKPFYFEGNLAWGLVNTKEEWKRIVRSYSGDINALRKARVLDEMKNSSVPRFGFFGEYDGSLRLGEWADKNKVDLRI